jgi:hypothetical protein
MQAQGGCGSIAPTNSQAGTKEVSGQYQLRPLYLWERTQYPLCRMLGVPRDQSALCKVIRLQKKQHRLAKLSHYVLFYLKIPVEIFIVSDSCTTVQGSYLIWVITIALKFDNDTRITEIIKTNLLVTLFSERANKIFVPENKSCESPRGVGVALTSLLARSTERKEQTKVTADRSR